MFSYSIMSDKKRHDSEHNNSKKEYKVGDTCVDIYNEKTKLKQQKPHALCMHKNCMSYAYSRSREWGFYTQYI